MDNETPKEKCSVCEKEYNPDDRENHCLVRSGEVPLPHIPVVDNKIEGKRKPIISITINKEEYNKLSKGEGLFLLRRCTNKMLEDMEKNCGKVDYKLEFFNE